jgi:hypothetical protein
MSILILGQSCKFKKEDIRCSPIDVNLWYDKPFTCVDLHCGKNDTDILYNIYKSIDYRFNENGVRYNGYWVWKFAEDNSYDIIIDYVTGMYMKMVDKKYINHESC